MVVAGATDMAFTAVAASLAGALPDAASQAAKLVADSTVARFVAVVASMVAVGSMVEAASTAVVAMAVVVGTDKRHLKTTKMAGFNCQPFFLRYLAPDFIYLPGRAFWFHQQQKLTPLSAFLARMCVSRRRGR